MWPWGHAAVGYLLWSTWMRRADGRTPTAAEAFSVVLGTQFPDLVDKPLAWGFNVLPAGRSLAHSLLVAAVVISVVYAVMRHRQQEPIALAFGVAYVSHSLSDSIASLILGDYGNLTYLLWPMLPAPVYGDESVTSPLAEQALIGWALIELVLVAYSLLRWWRDGAPGLANLVGVLRAAR